MQRVIRKQPSTQVTRKTNTRQLKKEKWVFFVFRLEEANEEALATLS